MLQLDLMLVVENTKTVVLFGFVCNHLSSTAAVFSRHPTAIVHIYTFIELASTPSACYHVPSYAEPISLVPSVFSRHVTA
jgi:hypothetical protein